MPDARLSGAFKRTESMREIGANDVFAARPIKTTLPAVANLRIVRPALTGRGRMKTKEF
jgi:hypothetical protein